MLTDSYLRRHDYLRVSITDKCNLRCRYCMPPEGVQRVPHERVLRNEEFARLIAIFVSLGISKVRFTGGEPLVRKGFIDIISSVRSLYPGLELCLTTNGTLLQGFIGELRRLSVRKLNISLDSVTRETYEAVTRGAGFDDVMANIDRVLSYRFFDVKINTVLIKEAIGELDAYLDHFKDRDVTLRFIEKMPFVEDECGGGSYISSDLLVDELRARGALSRNTAIDTNVSIMYDFTYRGRYRMRIGVIPPMSRKFCASCNRLRVTSEGFLKTCLHSNSDHDLKDLLRNGASDDDLRQEIRRAVALKHEAHTLDCRSDEGGCSALIRSGFMSKIGG